MIDASPVATGGLPTSSAPPAPHRERPDDAVVLRLAGVTKSYPGEPPVEVLHGIDLTVRRSELVAIVGKSGSGKSTLLHILGTLDTPTSGTAMIAGLEVSRLSDTDLSGLRARRIGFVFQQFFLLDGQSALDNVANGLLYAGIAPAERRRRATEVLGRVGLPDHLIEHPPQKLSGGERQRVAIARAFVSRPAIILADEPTGDLDSRAGREIIDLLLGFNRDEGTTIIVITHDLEIAARLPRQVEMLDGRISHDSCPEVQA